MRKKSREEERGKELAIKKRGKEREGKTEIPNPVPHLVVRDTVDVRRGYARDARASIAGLRADVACRWENKGDQKKRKGSKGGEFFFLSFAFPVPSLLSLSRFLRLFLIERQRTARAAVLWVVFNGGMGGGEREKRGRKKRKVSGRKRESRRKRAGALIFFLPHFSFPLTLASL